jgi:hypothetical protein
MGDPSLATFPRSIGALSAPYLSTVIAQAGKVESSF